MASLIVVGFALATYELNLKYKEHKKKKAYKALQKSQSAVPTTDNKRETKNYKTFQETNQTYEHDNNSISKNSFQFKVDEWSI